MNSRIPRFEELGNLLLEFKFNLARDDAIEAGRQIKKLYTNVSFEEDKRSFLKMYADFSFVVPISRHAESLSKYNENVYIFRNSYKNSKAAPSVIPGMNGVGHGDEMPLLFADTKAVNKFSDNDRIVSKKLVKLWASFVKNGKPTADEAYWPNVRSGSVTFMDIDIGPATLQFNPTFYKEINEIISKKIRHPITAY